MVGHNEWLGILGERGISAHDTIIVGVDTMRGTLQLTLKKKIKNYNIMVQWGICDLSGRKKLS